MPSFTDQTGNIITLNTLPRRIISLVPSQTELLFDLGLSDQIVGITKFCVHPEIIFRTKTRVGGTKQINFETIQKLQPDLILANKEENIREQIQELAQYYPVWTSDVHDIPTAIDMINSVGNICGKTTAANKLTNEIITSFSSLPQIEKNKKCCYLIWKDPYMTVGADTFIHAMLEAAGFENMFSDALRYPEISLQALNEKGCELLLLSSEPYPFKAHHLMDIQRVLPSTKILLVDGEMFSWYGSRMIHAANYFSSLHEALPDDAP